MKILSIDAILSTSFVLLVLIYFSMYFNIDFMNPIQNVAQNFYLTDFVFSRMKDYEKIPTDTNIVLVNVGDVSRNEIAKQIEIINSYHPKAIGIDLFFFKDYGQDNDSMLVSILSQVDRPVMVSKVVYNKEKDDFDSLVVSNEKFNRLATNGFANLIADTSGKNGAFRTARTFFPTTNVDKDTQYAFAIVIAKMFDSAAAQAFIDRNNETEVINYTRNHNKYTTYDVSDVLDGRVDPETIKGKIVLFGIMGPDLSTLIDEDVFFTPMNEAYIGRSMPDMYGVVIHANIISMILERNYIDSMPYWLTILLIVLIIYANIIFFIFLKTKAENWYEAISTFIVFVELFIIGMAVIYSIYLMDYEIKLQALFFALIIVTPVFELYISSLKPLFIKIYAFFIMRAQKMIKFIKTDSQSKLNENNK